MQCPARAFFTFISISRNRRCRFPSPPHFLLPNPAHAVVEVLKRILPAVGAALLHKKPEVSLRLVVCRAEHVLHILHSLYLPSERRIGKILCPRCGKDEEIIPVMPGLPDNGSHIVPVSRKAAAGRHKISEVIQTVLKGVPGGHRTHGKPAESPVIPGGGQPLRAGRLLPLYPLPAARRLRRLSEERRPTGSEGEKSILSS